MMQGRDNMDCSPLTKREAQITKRYRIMRRMVLALYLLVQVVTLSAGIPIFPNCYGEIAKCKVVDTAMYEVSYKIVVKLYTDPKYRHLGYTDVQTLLIGKRISATYSKDILREREIADEERKRGAELISNHGGITFPEDIFKGYPSSKELTASYRLFLGAGYGRYTEPKPNFGWEILPETKNILGYKCQKAKGKFRGREYVAWFSSDIPLSDGPWKFCGLPGLILAVQDTKEEFVFTCTAIENKKSTPIRFWTYPHIETTRDKLRRIILRMHKQPIVFCEQATGAQIYMGNTNKHRDFSFEWLWLEVE